MLMVSYLDINVVFKGRATEPDCLGSNLSFVRSWNLHSFFVPYLYIQSNNNSSTLGTKGLLAGMVGRNVLIPTNCMLLNTVKWGGIKVANQLTLKQQVEEGSQRKRGDHESRDVLKSWLLHGGRGREPRKVVASRRCKRKGNILSLSLQKKHKTKHSPADYLTLTQ